MEADSLKQMTRISFMRQRRIQGKAAAVFRRIQVNDIFCILIDRRRQIKGGTQIIFQRVIDIFYFAGDCRNVGKVL